MVPSVQPNGEKHVVATYVVNRKYEPVLAQCNDFVNFAELGYRRLEACAGASRRGWWHKIRSSALDASRHWPGCRLSSRMAPIATRIKRSVGWPTAAVMRLTCLFFPSWITTSSHAVGTLRRTLIGTGRSHNSGSCLSRRTWAGLVRIPLSITPRRNWFNAPSAGTRSTWAQYNLGRLCRGAVMP